MSIKVYIKPIVYKCGGDIIVAEVDGFTVGQCLDHLVKQFPGIEQDLFVKDDKLLSYVNIFVNGQIAYPDDLARPVKDADEIYVIPMIQGG